MTKILDFTEEEFLKALELVENFNNRYNETGNRGADFIHGIYEGDYGFYYQFDGILGCAIVKTDEGFRDYGDICHSDFDPTTDKSYNLHPSLEELFQALTDCFDQSFSD